MADYKDIITGTLNHLISKAKEAADTVSKTVAESGTVKDIYEQGASKAKAYGRIAKLSLEITGSNEELKKVYTEIGKLCYEQNKDNPGDFYASLFAQAEEIMADIEAKQGAIQALKADAEAEAESDIDVEIEQFEDVVDATASDGAAEAVEEIVDAAEEAVKEAAETFAEVVDDIKDEIKD